MNTFKTLALAAIAILSSASLSSCSFADECPMQESANAKNIELGVSMAMGRNAGVDPDALTESNPFHVIAFVADKTGQYNVKWFEDNAYCDMTGAMHWVKGNHNWPGSGVKFVAYWPAGAEVTLDSNGNVVSTSADNLLVAETSPVNHLSSDLSLFFVPIH